MRPKVIVALRDNERNGKRVLERECRDMQVNNNWPPTPHPLC